MAVHFVGFRDGRQYQSAIKIFGKPDFFHRYWDDRAKFGGEWDSDCDFFVFAVGCENDTPNKYAFNDSEVF